MQVQLLKNRNFLIFTFGQLISSVGVPFSTIAMSWFVYSLTGSTLALGGVLLSSVIPIIILRLFAGTLVDRWDRKKTMLTIDLIRAAILLIPFLLFISNSLEIWHLYAANILLGFCEAFFRPAAFTVVPNIVNKEDLLKANGTMNSVLTSSAVIGPMLAGIVVATFNAPTALLVNSFTFVLSALTIIFLPNNKAEQKADQKFLIDVLDGFVFFKKYPGLIWILILSAITNMGIGIILILMVPYAMDVAQVGSVGYGMMKTAVGIGLMTGSLVAILFRKFLRRSIMLNSHILAGGFLFLMMFSISFPMTLLLLVGYGLSVTILNTFSTTIFQELVPDQLRGRVQSVRLLITQGTMPIGMAIGAIIGYSLEIGNVLGIIGFSIVLSGLIAKFIPSIHIVDIAEHESPPQHLNM